MCCVGAGHLNLTSEKGFPQTEACSSKTKLSCYIFRFRNQWENDLSFKKYKWLSCCKIPKVWNIFLKLILKPCKVYRFCFDSVCPTKQMVRSDMQTQYLGVQQLHMFIGPSLLCICTYRGIIGACKCMKLLETCCTPAQMGNYFFFMPNQCVFARE